MVVRSPRDPWRVVWQAAVYDGTLALILFTTAAALAVAAWFPQMPRGDSVAYARQLSSLQARFGNAARMMQSFGLFDITRSWGFRSLVALIAVCVVLRTIELGGRLLNRTASSTENEVPNEGGSFWPGAASDLFSLLSHAGVLLLLSGVVVSQLWGWHRSALIVQGDAWVVLPGSDTWVALNADGRSVAHSSGLRVQAEDWGPGAIVRATDGAGRSLSLQQNPGAEPAPELAVPLVQDPDLGTRDALLAIPQAQLIVRLLPEAELGSESTGGLLVQAYRSPSGELVAEAVVGEKAALEIGDVTLEIVSSPYARLAVTHSPGAGLSAAGVLVLLGGVLATAGQRALQDRERTAMEAELGEDTQPAQPAQSGEA